MLTKITNLLDLITILIFIEDAMMFSTVETRSKRLQGLIVDSFKEQWSPEDKIIWDQTVKLPDGIDKRTYVDMVSQLYYAEEATIHIIGSMLQQIPDFQARQYLCTQAIDEARHAEIYRRYLEILGDIAPINEGLKSVLSSGINLNHGYCGSVVALNVVMEGEAINQQKKRIQTLPCPLFKQINEAIIRDEARHSAFGKIYMKMKLSTLDEDERQAIYQHVSKLWYLWASANEGRYFIDGAEILRTESGEIDQRWKHQEKMFRYIGLIE